MSDIPWSVEGIGSAEVYPACDTPSPSYDPFVYAGKFDQLVDDTVAAIFGTATVINNDGTTFTTHK